jgi:hypothetical protein
MIFSKVDFPMPLLPTKADFECEGIVKLIELKADFRRKPKGYIV